jgi:hypothetical protein
VRENVELSMLCEYIEEKEAEGDKFSNEKA